MPSKEQQIQDITEALQLATPDAEIWGLLDKDYGYTYLFSDAINSSHAYTACVNRENIGIVTYQNQDGIGMPFDCAAYLGCLRDKGYKI